MSSTCQRRARPPRLFFRPCVQPLCCFAVGFILLRVCFFFDFMLNGFLLVDGLFLPPCLTTALRPQSFRAILYHNSRDNITAEERFTSITWILNPGDGFIATLSTPTCFMRTLQLPSLRPTRNRHVVEISKIDVLARRDLRR